MSDITADLERSAKKAARAARSAGRATQSTAAVVAGEARVFGARSGKAIKRGAAQVAEDAHAAQDAAGEGAEQIQAGLRAALEALQEASEEISRWAGTRAVQAKDQATHIVKERPIGSVASMFAVGALIGVIAGVILKD